MFTRTDVGLSSEHLFHDAEWIIYCEGRNRNDETSSLDEAFWSRIFAENGISCHCKSSGSKTDLLPLVSKVISGEVSNVIIAMDRDHDHLNGKMLDDAKIFYTFGYSWESDVSIEFSVRQVLQLFANIVRTTTISDEFEEYRKGVSRNLRRLTALDFKYSNHPQSLFDREKPLSIILTQGQNGPQVRKERLLQKAAELPRHEAHNLSREAYQSLCGVKDFFGKVIFQLFYQWFVYRTSRLQGSRKVQSDLVAFTMINSMSLRDENIDRNQYFAHKVMRLMQANDAQGAAPGEQ